MKLLACILYDPAVAVTKATTAASVMAAMDTTNLRIAFTAPASGMVRVRLKGTLHGGTTIPQVHLGVMAGASVVARCAAKVFGPVAATSLTGIESEFCVNVTPGASLTWDAAWGVETVAASSGIKYGGPNDTTVNNAFGGFCFEIWDAAPPSAGATAAEVWANGTRTLTAGTNIALAKGTGVTGFNDIAAADVWAVGTRTLTANPGLSAAQVNAECDTAIADAALATAANLATVDTVVDAIKLKTDNLPSDPADQSLIIAATDQIRTDIAAIPAAPSAAAVRAEIDANSTKLDAAVSTRLASADYLAPDNAGVAAIQAKTDSLTFTVAGKLDVHSMVVNGVTIIGTGTEVDPWRGAP